MNQVSSLKYFIVVIGIAQLPSSEVIEGGSMCSIHTVFEATPVESLCSVEMPKNLHSRLGESLFHPLKIGRERDIS